MIKKVLNFDLDNFLIKSKVIDDNTLSVKLKGWGHKWWSLKLLSDGVYYIDLNEHRIEFNA